MSLKIKIEEIEKTTEQKITETQQEIAGVLLFLHTQITQGMSVVETAIANNRHGLSAQQVRDSYGDDIAQLDSIGAKAAELLAMVEVE